jgi:hypothetical protein
VTSPSPVTLLLSTQDKHRRHARRTAALDGGCRKKPFEKTRSMLAERHLRAAVHDALAMDRLRATDQLTVFRPHPYKRSSGLARGFSDSLDEGQQPGHRGATAA